MARQDHIKKKEYNFETPLADYVIEGYFEYWAKDWRYVVTAPIPYETLWYSMYLGCSVRYEVLDNTTEEVVKEEDGKVIINIAYRAKHKIFQRYFGADWEASEKELRNHSSKEG